MPITDLPIEILSLIFSEIYWAERRNASELETYAIAAQISRERITPVVYDKHTQWRDDDLQAVPNLFPHTTASVCRLWQNILSQTPQYWTRFVLDLDDPGCPPFDVFGWSRSDFLNVVIRSNPQETSEDAKKHESERVSSACQALTPYIQSCKSLVFDVRYASSLPSPAPFFLKKNRNLKVFIMDSEIDDVILPIAFDIAPRTTIGYNIFNIDRLSLYGPAFMELLRIDPILRKRRWIPSLTLSHLQCCWKTESSYTINELLKFIITDFTIKHARFVGEQPPVEASSLYNLKFHVQNSLTFEDVDPNFISAFIPRASSKWIPIFTFKNCTLPRLDAFYNSKLFLIGIPDTQSLKNIMFLRFHRDVQLSFTSCPGFNDDFLNWLASDRRLPALRVFSINKCGNFTFAALRAFMETRNTYDMDYIPDENEDEPGSPLAKLIVRSSGLGMTHEDKIWLKEYTDGGRGSIDWIEDD